MQLPRPLKRLGGLLAVVALIVAGCGSDSSDTSAPSQFPTGSVRAWFDLLDAGNTTAALDLTHQEAMVLILAAENSMDPADLATLLRRTATEGSAAEYLADFSDSLRARYGSSLAGVSVDRFNRIGDTFAAVFVSGEGEATIITRRAPGGLWQVDLVGTVGPVLVTQLGRLLEQAGDDADGDTIRESFAATVLPALDAAALADPEDLTLAAELRAMRRMLGD